MMTMRIMMRMKMIMILSTASTIGILTGRNTTKKHENKRNGKKIFVNNIFNNVVTEILLQKLLKVSYQPNCYGRNKNRPFRKIGRKKKNLKKTDIMHRKTRERVHVYEIVAF